MVEINYVRCDWPALSELHLPDPSGDPVLSQAASVASRPQATEPTH